jgi:subtilisin family serine protease
MAITYYLVFHRTEELLRLYSIENVEEAIREVKSYLEHVFYDKPPSLLGFHVTRLPARGIRLEAKGIVAEVGTVTPAGAEPLPRELVVSITIEDETLLDTIRKAEREKKEILAGGADLPIAMAEYWCPRDALDPVFGRRDAAEALINVPYIRDIKNLRGQNVNVVIVDQGVDANLIENQLGGAYGGGWNVGTIEHGSTASRHGMMIARNILSIAPEATLFDLPLIPERIGDPAKYLSDANAAFISMLDGIKAFKEARSFPGSWVIVNAWAVFDRRLEQPPGSYTSNPQHAFYESVRRAVEEEKADVIFCAGNCGQFCPDPRCGPLDRGPGESIFGANSHKDVLTVGAVRTDTMWLGYSSQGPGQPALSKGPKPDLCAPSQFCETDDTCTVNAGTSAASAVAAGVVAALRSRWDRTKVSPADLIAVLNSTAQKVESDPGTHRYGHGIINAKAAAEALCSDYG